MRRLRRLGFRPRRLGLRPRLLAALVFTSAVTLLVAALTLLPSLQTRLTEQAARDLETATATDVRFFYDQLTRTLKETTRLSRQERLDRLYSALASRANTLGQRTNSRVVLATPVPGDEPVADTLPTRALPTRTILRTLLTEQSSITRSDDQVTVAQPIQVPVALDATRESRGQTLFVLVTQKQLTDVAEAVRRVRTAFAAAAAVGLLVALLVGVGLTSTLLRRLRRLRSAALRVTREGTGAPTPRDDGRDEVGDLARALATMQAALRRQEAARRSFIATASHELRTPLTSLQGTLELLDEDLRDGRLDLDDAHDQIARAQGELRRLSRLASELLDLSRLDAAIPLRVEPVELGEVTRAVVAEFELRARDAGIALDVLPPIGPCWARGDPGAVARAIRILIDNALRYSPQGEAIAIAAGYHGEQATVEVADRGPGVPAEERDRIFERFERGSANASEGGFGLGLAIGRELAQRMGGGLALLEHPDGASGARFVLRLPIELPAGSQAAEPEPEPAPSAP